MKQFECSNSSSSRSIPVYGRDLTLHERKKYALAEIGGAAP